MIAAAWDSLEIAQLVVGALIPVAIFAAGLAVAREARRYEERQWVRRKLFETRLERWDAIAPLLNDLYCFFALVGHFRSIDPPRAIALKRELDKIAYAHAHVLGAAFMERYYEFMSACFLTFVAAGEDAKLRASMARQRMERGQWDPQWDRVFVEEDRASRPGEVQQAYNALLASFQDV